MRLIKIILLAGCLFSFPVSSWAGGAVAAVKQRQLIEQQMIEREIARRQQEELVRQYMIAYQQAAVQQYVQAQKQAIAARAAQEQAVAQHMAQQMVQEIAAYKMAAARREQMLAERTVMQIRVVQNVQYQQALMARQAQQAQQYVQQVAAAQVIAAQQQRSLAEYQQALLVKEIKDRAAYEQVQQIQQARGMRAAQEAQQLMAYQAASIMNKDKLYEEIPSSYVKEVVPVSDLWKSLDKSSKAWPLIIDKKAKGVTVSHYMQKLAGEGGTIRKDPMHYADMIDSLSKENPTMLLQPFVDVLRIMAIIEYDFDNGVDRDALARRVFPDERSFRANKQRLGR